MRRLASTCLALAVLAAGVFACSTTETTFVEEEDDAGEGRLTRDAGFDSRPPLDSGLGVLTFMPKEAYSGFDGTHTFKVPIAVYDSGDDLDVTATDPSAVEIAPTKLAAAAREDGTTDTGKYFLVTVKRAGKTTLRATSGGKTAEATITVATYAGVRWQAGKTRYENEGSGGEPACVACHAGGDAIDHSPAALATATDDEVSRVITTGISTGGFPIRIDGKLGHKWTVSDAEREGLVTYLRSLEPRGFE